MGAEGVILRIPGVFHQVRLGTFPEAVNHISVRRRGGEQLPGDAGRLRQPLRDPRGLHIFGVIDTPHKAGHRQRGRFPGVETGDDAGGITALFARAMAQRVRRGRLGPAPMQPVTPTRGRDPRRSLRIAAPLAGLMLMP
jgi:hypothetical protein